MFNNKEIKLLEDIDKYLRIHNNVALSTSLNGILDKIRLQRQKDNERKLKSIRKRRAIEKELKKVSDK